MKKIKLLCILLLNVAGAVTTANAETIINMHLITPANNSKNIGTITATDTSFGLLLTPHLTNLTPGIHGFHVHQTADCDQNGMAAGGHLDPAHTDKHLGPYTDNGHLGDMPFLYVDQKGIADSPILAPRLKEGDLKDHSIMIHAGGDNYSDNPPMGGGGARIACGIVK